jgi:xylose dehydrogenase (NAD/NADP)
MTVRWGFLGAGYVATQAMAAAVHNASGAVLQAVASRDPLRSAALGPVKVHQTYSSLIEDPEIDAVYINLRNGQHREWVERSLEAGRHVLCEKPLAVNADDAAAMLAAAHRHDRLLVEAVWMRWHPRFQRMVHIVNSGALGQLISIDSAFTFTGQEMQGNYRLDPTQGGGALLDVGCYQVHTWLGLCGHSATNPVIADIKEVDAMMGPTGVDLTTTSQVQLRVAQGVAHAPSLVAAPHLMATQTSSFAMPPEQSLVVRGELMTMRIGAGEAFTNWKAPSSLWIGETEEFFDPVDPFETMVSSMSSRIAGDTDPQHDRVPSIDSLRSAEIIDEIGDRLRSQLQE